MDARAAAAAEQPVARVSASPSEVPTATPPSEVPTATPPSATPSELPSELPEVGTDGAVCAGPSRFLYIDRSAPARRDLYN